MNKYALTIALVLLASPAAASQGLFCASGAEDLDIHIPLGGGPGLVPLAATIRAGDLVWTTDPNVPGATPMIDAQSVSVDDRYYFDFSDPNYEGIILSVRLFRAGSGDEVVIGGTLDIPGTGAWPISCDIG